MEQAFFPVTRREAERQGIPFSSAANKNALFPSQLRGLRESREISQAALAKALGVSKSTIGLWEMGDTLPDAKAIYDIASFFNVSADWLLGLSDERAINGDLAQASRYIGLPANSTEKLHELSLSSDAHSKAPLFVINEILSSRIDDFITWAWRAAMSNCAIGADELAATRRNADIHLVEIANSGSGEIVAAVEVPLSDYEHICTSTAIGIIRESADKSLKIFKDNFKEAFQLQKSKE